MVMNISVIKIREERRPIDRDKVRRLADSIKEIGLLNPVTVAKDCTLVAGLHRIEAYKLLGKTEIPANYLNMTGLKAELAEIDENLIRNDLDDIAIGELAIRRDEILEALGQRAKQGDNRFTHDRGELNSPLQKTTADIAKEIGISERVLQNNKQLARNLAPEAKAVVRENAIPKNDALKLAGMDREQQKAVTGKIASGKAANVAEARYQVALAEPQSSMERVAEYRKTGRKPEGWIGGADDELAEEEAERDRRIKDEFDKRAREAEEKNAAGETAMELLSDLETTLAKRAEFKNRIRLSDDGSASAFQDALIDYLESLEDDTRRVQACADIIKICKRISVNLQSK